MYHSILIYSKTAVAEEQPRFNTNVLVHILTSKLQQLPVPDNCVGVVVQDVQQDDEVLENVEEDRSHRQSLNRFPTYQEKLHFYLEIRIHTGFHADLAPGFALEEFLRFFQSLFGFFF
jgi:hypothetical protein